MIACSLADPKTAEISHAEFRHEIAREGEALGLGTSLHRVVIESEAVCYCPVGTSDNSPAIYRWGDEPIQTV